MTHNLKEKEIQKWQRWWITKQGIKTNICKNLREKMNIRRKPMEDWKDSNWIYWKKKKPVVSEINYVG